MIIFVRHGKTDRNLEMRMQGHIDIHLNGAGKQEIERSAEKINQFVSEKLMNIKKFRVVSSPLVRAAESARIISESLGLRYDGSSELLKEMNFGIFEGLTKDEILKKHGEVYLNFQKDKFNFRIPEGENFSDVLNRGLEFINHTKQDTIALTHGTYMKVLYSHLLGEPEPPSSRYFANACFFAVDGKDVTEVIS